MYKDQLAKTIRYLRKSIPLRQEDLAAKAGVSIRVVKDLEGARGNPTLDSLDAVLSVIGITLDQAFDIDTPMTSSEKKATEKVLKRLSEIPSPDKASRILAIQSRLTTLDEGQLGRVDKFITDLLKSAPASSSSSDVG